MDSKYSCVRCGYETENKYSMNTHLYKKKKPCPTAFNNIELTDDIKKYILENRIYKIPEITPEVTPEVKPEELKPEEVQKPEEVKLEEMKKPRQITMTFEELFNSNLLSDKQRKDLELMILLKIVMSLLKDAIFDPYEMYLIHYIDNVNFDQKLRDYYKFIGSLEFQPLVKGKSDNFIRFYRFYRDNEPEVKKTFKLSEKYMKLYESEKAKIIETEKVLLTKKVVDILFVKNIDNRSLINKQLGELFNMDEEFIKNNM